MVTTFGQPSARSHQQGVFKGGYTPKTQQRRGLQQKGDSFWGSFRCVLGEEENVRPRRGSLDAKNPALERVPAAWQEICDALNIRSTPGE